MQTGSNSSDVVNAMDISKISGSAFIARGVATLLLGFAVLLWPGATAYALLILFSAYLLCTGVVLLIGGFSGSHSGSGRASHTVLTIILGIAAIAAGVYLIRHPQVSLKTFMVIIGLSLTIQGIVDILDSFFGHNQQRSRFTLFLVGLLTAFAGTLIFFNPAAGGLAFIWIIGLQCLLAGPLLMVLGHQINKQAKVAAA